MINVINLARWEWFKLRHRWMPWVLLVILVLFFLIGVWGSWFAYQNLQSTGGQVPLPAQGGRPQMVACNELQEDASVLPQGTGPEILAGLRAQCQQRAAQRQSQLAAMYDDFTLPGSIVNTLGTVQTFGLMLLAILTASVIGIEYGLGTLRTALVRGTPLWPETKRRC